MIPIRYLDYCVFCFTRDSCAVRFTKKGKPYLSCPVCMSRAFVNRIDGLLGPAVVPHLIKAAGRLPWFDVEFREMTAYVTNMGKENALPEVPKPILYSDERAKESTR